MYKIKLDAKNSAIIMMESRRVGVYKSRVAYVSASCSYISVY